MELILLIAFVSLCTGEGWDALKRHWNGFRSGSASKSGSRGNRFVSAAKTDAGYWARSALTAFPQFRHGFAESWHRHRRDHDVLAAKRARARADSAENRARILPEIDGHKQRLQAARDDIRRHRLQDGEEGTWPKLLTARSKAGKPINRFTGGFGDTIAVYDQDDLDHRLAVAAEDPDLEVSVREAPPLGDLDELPSDEAMRWTSEPSATTPDGTVFRRYTVGLPGTDFEPSTTTTDSEGNQMASTATDINYPEVVKRTDALKATIEQIVSNIVTAQKQFEEVADGVAAVDADSKTQGAALDLAGAIGEAAMKVQTVQEYADQFRQDVTRDHGGIHEAIQDAPVAKPAQREFYTE